VFNVEFTYVAGHQVAEFTVFAFKFGQIHCKPICLGSLFFFEKIDFKLKIEKGNERRRCHKKKGKVHKTPQSV